MRTEDGRIVSKCLNGEPEAFGFLVDRYKESVYAFAYSKLRNFHDAEDVTQEVFLKAYQKLRTLRRWDSFHAWIYSIASNLCKNWIRERARRPDSEFLEDEDPETLSSLSVREYTKGLARRELHEELATALDSLPEIYRQVLVLYYLGGMNNREIATFLGKSPSAIKQRLRRARTQLKEEMLAMMRETFEEQGLPVGFTFRVVEAVKRIRVQPVPRTSGLPWGLSLATGIIMTVLSLNPHLSVSDRVDAVMGTALPGEAQVTEVGEMPVDVLRIARMPVSFGKQGNSYIGGFQLPEQQNAILMAPRGEVGKFPEEPSAQLGKGSLGYIAYSPDGKILAATGGFGIWLYDASNLDEIALMSEEPYSAIAFSPDGKTLAVNNWDYRIQLWDVNEQMQIGTMGRHTGYIYSIAFSPDGKILASCSYDKTILLWDIQERRQTGVLRGHTEGVTAIAYSPDGKMMASGSWDKTIRLWDVQEQEQMGLLLGHTEPVRSVAFSLDGKVLASGSNDKTIRLWNVQEQKQTGILQGHTDQVLSIAFSPDGKTLASGSSDKTIRIWDIQEQRQTGLLQGLSAYSIAFSPDGRTLASGETGESDVIRLWDVQEQEQTAVIDGFVDLSYSMAFSPDGKMLASGERGVIRLWDVQGQKQSGLLKRYSPYWLGTASVAFSPDGGTIASVHDKEIYLFDAQEQKQIGTLKGHTEYIVSLAFTPDGKILASAGNQDKTVRLWDVAEQNEIGVLRDASWTHCISISPDGETLAVAVGGERLVRLWDIRTQGEVGVLRDAASYAYYVAISPDGRTVASCNQLGQIRLWDMETQEQIGSLEGHISGAHLTFSPDGKWLVSVGGTNASGDMDWTTRIWDVHEQEQIFAIEEHYKVSSVAFSPSGKWLASAGYEGTILLWEVNLTVPGWSVEPTGKLPGTWGGAKKTELLQNFPNPFNPETWIPFSLAEQEHVAIRIYSSTGQLIRTLDLGQKPPGAYLSKEKAAYWDGRSKEGEELASGIYFYVMNAGDFTATKKMTVSR